MVGVGDGNVIVEGGLKFNPFFSESSDNAPANDPGYEEDSGYMFVKMLDMSAEQLASLYGPTYDHGANNDPQADYAGTRFAVPMDGYVSVGDQAIYSLGDFNPFNDLPLSGLSESGHEKTMKMAELRGAVGFANPLYAPGSSHLAASREGGNATNMTTLHAYELIPGTMPAAERQRDEMFGFGDEFGATYHMYSSGLYEDLAEPFTDAQAGTQSDAGYMDVHLYDGEKGTYMDVRSTNNEHEGISEPSQLLGLVSVYGPMSGTNLEVSNSQAHYLDLSTLDNKPSYTRMQRAYMSTLPPLSSPTYGDPSALMSSTHATVAGFDVPLDSGVQVARGYDHLKRGDKKS